MTTRLAWVVLVAIGAGSGTPGRDALHLLRVGRRPVSAVHSLLVRATAHPAVPRTGVVPRPGSRAGGSRVNSLEDYYKWFNAKARELPYPDRLEVLNTIDTPDHRAMYRELLKLRESGKLPAEWNQVLDDFYSRFF